MVFCDVYNHIINNFKPTPKKFYYLFSLKDMMKVFEGISLVPPKKLMTSDKLIRLWMHETHRVFIDRFDKHSVR